MKKISFAVLAVAAMVLAIAACGSGGNGSGDLDAACAGGSGCGEPCATGNSYGVGMYCTVGGGECANTPGRMAPFCTVDNEPTADAFCTRPCDPNADPVAQCGEDALCTNGGGSGPSGCLPVVCTQ